MAACFAAGAAGDWEDGNLQGGVLGAGMYSILAFQGSEIRALTLWVETWELENMCNSQFTIGGWHSDRSNRGVSQA